MRLDGPRVYLRPLGGEDTDRVLAWRSDPRIAEQFFSERPPTREEHEAWLDRVSQERDRAEFAIVLRETGAPIGTVGLSGISGPEPEYGILLGDPGQRGQGLATEASRLVIDHAFTSLGARAVTLNAFADNEPALRLYRRLGFVIAQRGSRDKQGSARPTVSMRLERANWSPRASTDPSCLVLGHGSIGRRHAKNLAALGVTDLRVYDPVPERATAAHEGGARIHSSLREALYAQPDLVLVCDPPSEHRASALAALEAGCDLFVEKPLALTLDQAEEVVATARDRGRVLAVGYNLRFHAGVRRTKELVSAGAIGRLLLLAVEFGHLLSEWRPGVDYRTTYSARADLGGGIVLDASHELDYMRWLAGEPQSVWATIDRLGDLEIDVEDAAIIGLRFEGGAVGIAQLDSLQRTYSRRCKIVGTEGTVEWDFSSGVRWYSGSDRAWTQEMIVPDVNEMYLEELRDVLDAVRQRRRPAVTGEDGVRALAMVDAAKRAARDRREITL